MERMEMAGNQRLWTVKDVATYLQASKSWVYQKAESGELPCYRIGGLLRFDPDAVQTYVQRTSM